MTTQTLRRGRRDWPIITGLLVLAFVPSVAGALRIAQLGAGVPRTPDNARFVDMPLPVVIHIVGAVTFAVLGAFQVAPRLRARHRRWHRIAGRIAFAGGLATAGSGLWMTAFYPLPATDNAVVNAARSVVGVTMLAGLVAAFLAARRRDIRTHRAWILRSYALAMGAGTQAFTSLPLIATMSETDPHFPAARAVAMIAGWLINLAVAEYAIRRPIR
ncbi:DUF2306 domain-containing protein [Dactylosporangium sp. CA-092794]|uniref:DUF2306 domain-containing protein n=1 Tax=Dactylosporangium sp. CA-092794 TaxID=3239929 RepID=UPI003D8F0F4E